MTVNSIISNITFYVQDMLNLLNRRAVYTARVCFKKKIICFLQFLRHVTV